jgi:hypothetical protein
MIRPSITYHPNGTLSIYDDISQFHFVRLKVMLSAKKGARTSESASLLRRFGSWICE